MDLELLKLEIDKIKLIKNKLDTLINKFNKIIIIGNGGSNAIASHITVDYTKFIPLLIKSVQDQQKIISSLEERIKKLEDKK